MKRLTIFFTIFVFLFSCQKEIREQRDSPDYLQQVKKSLKDSITANDYQTLDFSKAILTKLDSDKVIFLRIPFRGKLMRSDFVLLQTDLQGNLKRGKIIHLEGKDESYSFNGKIEITSLDRKENLSSVIDHGFIRAFHPAQRTDILPGIPVLPEVIVVTQLNPTGISYADYVLLSGLFGGAPTMSFYNTTEGSIEQPGIFGGGGSGGSPDGSVPVAPAIQVDYDSYVNHDAIDIQKYMKCFGSIPDAGATCSITIFSDIPVNGDPSKFFNWQTGSPGHTFISFRKSNGQQSVQQAFGWYPAQGWEAVTTTAPITGKFVDDANHEFNASYTVNINTLELQTGITEVLSLARNIKYDIDEYNCTDFALQIFNATVYPTLALDIPMYDIPGGSAPFGTATPNGLYQKLQEMQRAGGPAASNISIPLIGWAGSGNGPCN